MAKLTLMQFPSGKRIPNLSPFCMKVETLLRMGGLDYDIEKVSDPSKGPKGKMPALKDGAKIVGDSSLIQEHLKQHHGLDLDSHLTASEKATGHAIARMLEERTYWTVVDSRWIDEDNWKITSEFWFGSMPPPMKQLIKFLARRSVQSNLKGQGMSRHSTAEIQQFGIADIEALSDILGDKPYIFGDQPSSIDAIALSFLANLILVDMPSPIKDAAHNRENLVDYTNRGMAKWFPEYPKEEAG